MSSHFNPQTDFQMPTGFLWAAAAAGIKYPGRRDIGILLSDRVPCSCAATFTRNLFKAAPVTLSQQLLQQSNGQAHGVVVNSGCANAATGKTGDSNASSMAQQAQTLSQSETSPVLVCSTGTIGVQLPMDRIESGIRDAHSAAGSSREHFLDFASAILTTDTRHKIAWKEITCDGRSAHILACAKGSGMMQPNMATMLAFAATDVECEPQLLQECFSRVIGKSLNCVTVDGDTSTNDTAILLANGASGIRLSAGSKELGLFEAALLEVMTSISRQLARDGEGATKLIEVHVSGAADFDSARRAALAVGNSPLVKTAIYGRDANWGRIACALGYSGVSFDPGNVRIALGDLELLRNGAPMEMDEQAALEILSREFVRIEANIGSGSGTATVWTCDLTEKYIEINGSYRT